MPKTPPTDAELLAELSRVAEEGAEVSERRIELMAQLRERDVPFARIGEAVGQTGHAVLQALRRREAARS